jgi:hypothetical protein
MRTNIVRTLLLGLLPAALMGAHGGSLASDYDVGFQWKRSIDYVEGTVPGSSDGNPMRDQMGNEVWTLGWTSGGDLGSGDAWVFNPLTPSVWDDAWLGGRWSRCHQCAGGVNGNPPISQYGMTHDFSVQQGADGFMPVVEWANPTGSAAVLDLKGKLNLSWAGRVDDDLYVSPDIATEVVIAAISASGRERLLFSQLVQNPMPGSYDQDAPPSVAVPVSLSGVTVRSGEVLRFSLRGQSGPVAPSGWVNLGDAVRIVYQGAAVSPIPEPATAWLLCLGLVPLAARRWAAGRPARAQGGAPAAPAA